MGVKFNGLSDILNYNQPLTLLSNSVGAVSFWMKTTQSLANTNTGVIGHTNGSGVGLSGWMAILNSAVTNKISLIAYLSGSQRINISSTTSVNDNNWHHVVFNLNSNSGGNNALWLDGNSEANANASGAWNESNSLFLLGRVQDTFWPAFLGSLAEVAYWTGVNLDANEISALSKGFSPKLIRPTALQFYAPLERGFGNAKGVQTSAQSCVTGVVDHPRMVGGYAQGGYANSVTWNASDRNVNTALPNNKRTALKLNTDALDSSVRATVGLASAGSGYFEVVIDSVGGTGPFSLIGIGNSRASLTTYVGGDANGWGYYQDTGNKYTNATDSGAYGATYKVAGDVVMVAFKNGSLWFGKNGIWNGDPVAGTGAAFTGITGTLYPMVSLYKGLTTPTQFSGYFHPSSFSYATPTGYLPWDVEQPPSITATNLTPTGFDNWTASGSWTILGGGAAKGSNAANGLVKTGLLTNGQRYNCEIPYSATAYAKLRITDGSTLDYLTPTLGASDTLSFSFTATGTTMSVEADTAVFTGTLYGITLLITTTPTPVALVQRSSSTIAVADATAVTWDSTGYNQNSVITIAGTTMTTQSTGLYRIWGNYFVTANATGTRPVKNGAALYGGHMTLCDLAANRLGGGCSAIVSLSASDTLALLNWGGASNYGTGGLVYNNFGLEKLDPTTKYALVRKSADQTSVTSATISFDTEIANVGGWHSTSTNNDRLTVPAGVTRVRLVGNIVSSGVTANGRVEILKNGVADVAGLPAQRRRAGGGSFAFNLCSPPINVVAGDYFQIKFDADAATTIQVIEGTWFSIEEVPASIKSCLVHNSAGQAVTTTNAAFLYDTNDYDPSGMHSTSTNTNRLTVPAGCTYARVSCYVKGASGSAQPLQAQTVKTGSGGTDGRGIDFNMGVNYDYQRVHGVSAWNAVSPGDYFECQVQSPGGGSFTAAGGWFAMECF